MDETGIAASYFVILFQSATGGVPGDDVAQQYWEAIGEPDYPVTADVDQMSLDATEYEGNPLPGICVLAPDRTILDCTTGHGKSTSWALDLIRSEEGL